MKESARHGRNGDPEEKYDPSPMIANRSTGSGTNHVVRHREGFSTLLEIGPRVEGRLRDTV